MRRGVSLLPEWRKLVCGVMLVVWPTSLMTQDSGGAMLHADEDTWVNGNLVRNSSAIFPLDQVQTQKGNGAKIDASGSTVSLRPDTLLQFGVDELVLDHGSLELDTSREVKVRVNCMIVAPLARAWTRYDVIDLDGKVTVAAYENDVKIHYEGRGARLSKQAWAADVTVHAGEQVTRDGKCSGPAKPSAAVGANGAILNNPWVVAGGAVAIGLTCVVVCHNDDPISPYKP